MKVDYHGQMMPYPLNIIRGKLRLIGLGITQVEEVIAEIRQRDSLITEQEILKQIDRRLASFNREFQSKFQILLDYDKLRRADNPVPPIILVIEGASATGKSILAMSILSNLGATRILSTDSIRQILRSTHSKEKHPELFCHTYQAHKHKMSGDPILPEVVRGYLAQVDLMTYTLETTVARIIDEGAEAIIEGVHIIPGSFIESGPSVIEILVNPSRELHKTMFHSKRESTGLKTVSGKSEVRDNEFESTRSIQDFMLGKAQETEIHILDLFDYEESEATLNVILLNRIKALVSTYGSGN